MAQFVIGSAAGSASLDATLRRLTNTSTHRYSGETSTGASGGAGDASGDTVSISLTGIGITYDQNGLPFGGNYTSIVETRSGVLVASLTNAFVSVASLIDTQTVDTGKGTAGLLNTFRGYDLIVGNDGGDILHGFAAHDVIVGGAGGDTITAPDGGSRLVPGLGQNIVTGGNGQDNLVIDAFRSQTTLSDPSHSGFVIGAGFSDTVSGVESVTFTDGTQYYGTGTAGGQVYRLYEAILARAPDTVGLGYWSAEVERGVDLKTISAGFMGSVEFQTSYGALTNAQFVDTLYQNVLGRAGDSAGVAYWNRQLGSGQLDRTGVVTSFSESAEFVQKTAPGVSSGVFAASPAAVDVLRIYELMLGRAPDAGGFKYWVEQHGGSASANAMASAGGPVPVTQSIAAIERGFMATQEYRAIYDGLNPADFVTKVYQEAFNRAPDAQGLSYWVGQINSGHQTAQGVLHCFAGSAEMTTRVNGLIQNGISLGT